MSKSTSTRSACTTKLAAQKTRLWKLISVYSWMPSQALSKKSEDSQMAEKPCPSGGYFFLNWGVVSPNIRSSTFTQTRVSPFFRLKKNPETLSGSKGIASRKEQISLRVWLP